MWPLFAFSAVGGLSLVFTLPVLCGRSSCVDILYPMARAFALGPKCFLMVLIMRISVLFELIFLSLLLKRFETRHLVVVTGFLLVIADRTRSLIIAVSLVC